MINLDYYIEEWALTSWSKELDLPRPGDAGIDLYAAEGIRIFSGKTERVGTGLHIRIPENMVGIIKDRSSVASNHGLHVLAGVIDHGYTGEIVVLCHNLSGRCFDIKNGAKIAQLLIVPTLPYANYAARKVESVDDLGATIRGQDGFGSTGE